MDDIERRLKDLGDRAGRDVAYREVPASRIVRRARLRRAFLVVAPTAAAVLVAAVAYPSVKNLSDDGVGVRVAGDLGFAAAATEEAGSARVEMEFEMEFDGRTIRTSAVGEVDFEHRRSRLVMEETQGLGVGRVEIIAIGDSVYQRMPDAPGEDAPKWFKMDLPTGQSAFGTAGPTDFLEFLESFTSDVTDLGEEELEGVSVTHYRVIIDPTKVPGQAGVDLEFDPMDVWVDELDRIRMLTFASSVEGGLGGDATMQMTMRMWDFGVPVDVEAPDPDDVTDEPLRAEDHRISTGDEELNEFGTSDETYVTGASGIAGPNILLASAGSESLVCVQNLPEDTTGVAIVHESSGRRIVTIGAEDVNAVGDTGSSGACAPSGIPTEDGEAIIQDPAAYTLIAKVEGSDDVVVELTNADSLRDE